MGWQGDFLKWVLSLIILLAGLIINHYYSEVYQPIRLIGFLFVLFLTGFLLSLTKQGQSVVALFHDARMELRKVVWPTREETLQTTLVIAIMVVVLAFILWGIDGLLVWFIGLMTGHSI